MKLCFYISENKVFDDLGTEIIEDEKGIVTVKIDGFDRRFVKCKLINWLALNPEIRQAKTPKPKRILSQFDAVEKAKTMTLKPKKVKVKVIREPKPPKIRVAKERIIKPKKEKVVKLKLIKEPKPKKEKVVKIKVKTIKEKFPKVSNKWYAPKEVKIKPIREKKQMGRPRINPPKIKTGYVNRRGGEFGFAKKQIYCITLDKIFDSNWQAAKELGLNRSAIHHVCKGIYKQTKGYVFKYNETS
jgi:hypothetical protein